MKAVSQPDLAQPAQSARILVVDDEKFIRDILADFLGMEGYVVRTAEDGAAALDELDHAPLRSRHQRPEDAAHGRHRAARADRQRTRRTRSPSS